VGDGTTGIPQRAVPPARGQQLVVGAGLGDLAVSSTTIWSAW
jgi:hypothetical protein